MTFSCQASIFEVDTSVPLGNSGTVFGHKDVKCWTSFNNRNHAYISLIRQNNLVIRKGLLYGVSFDIFNRLIAINSVERWTIKTYADLNMQFPLDVGAIDDFSLQSRAKSFSIVQPVGPALWTGATVTDVRIRFQFVAPFRAGDVVTMWAPMVYDLTSKLEYEYFELVDGQSDAIPVPLNRKNNIVPHTPVTYQPGIYEPGLNQDDFNSPFLTSSWNPCSAFFYDQSMKNSSAPQFWVSTRTLNMCFNVTGYTLLDTNQTASFNVNGSFIIDTRLNPCITTAEVLGGLSYTCVTGVDQGRVPSVHLRMYTVRIARN